MSERFDTFRPPPPEPDPWQTIEAEPVADEALDPRVAAALLERTTREAALRFDVQQPLLLLVAAVTVLVAYGAVWFSVRNQHPYVGPSGTALAVLYGTLAVWIAFVATFTRRVLSGRSSRQRRIEGVVFGTVWICVYIFEGALHYAGASKGVAYGIWPAVAPLVVVGAAAAGYEAAHERPVRAGLATTAVALGVFASFAGPRDVWGVLSVGLCVLLLGAAAAQAWRRRGA